MPNTNTNTTYNGWTNYETWNWALWLDNDQGQQDYWIETAQRELDFADGDIQEASYRVSQDLEYDMDDYMENSVQLSSGPHLDLLNAALSHINWYEIAAHYVELASEQAAA